MKITSIDQLKVGGELLRRGVKEEIQAVCGNLAWVKNEWGICGPYTCENLVKEEYTIEEPKWEPKEDELYYFPDFSEEDLCCNTMFFNSDAGDKQRLINGLCFRTKEEAIAAAKKMLKALKDE